MPTAKRNGPFHESSTIIATAFKNQVDVFSISQNPSSHPHPPNKLTDPPLWNTRRKQTQPGYLPRSNQHNHLDRLTKCLFPNRRLICYSSHVFGTADQESGFRPTWEKYERGMALFTFCSRRKSVTFGTGLCSSTGGCRFALNRCFVWL